MRVCARSVSMSSGKQSHEEEESSSYIIIYRSRPRLDLFWPAKPRLPYAYTSSTICIIHTHASTLDAPGREPLGP